MQVIFEAFILFALFVVLVHFLLGLLGVTSWGFALVISIMIYAAIFTGMISGTKL